MKKFIVALALLTAIPAFAQWRTHYHYYGYGNNWVAPLIVGGVIGAELARPNAVIVEQQPVYVQQQPVVVQQQPRETCTAWVETQQPNGTVTRTRTCTQ
jgi:hypothetical protein